MKIILSHSGGLDSTVLLAESINMHDDYDIAMGVVFFRYGSKHQEYEYEAHRRIINYYHSKLEVHFKVFNIDLQPIMNNLKQNCSTLLRFNEDVPEGHYDDPKMKSTVVPGRNMLMAASLASLAESYGYDTIAMGIHAGDFNIYPDCRPAWVEAVHAAVAAQTENKVKMTAPFRNHTKADIIARGAELQVPFTLTRTCYKQQEIACGKCASCQERLTAFDLNGITDPLSYESRELIKM